MKAIVCIALILAVTSAWAFELSMTDEEKEVCLKGGGCFLATKEKMEEAMGKAFQAGKRSCYKAI